ncbi:FH1/FH2 domain-containing protein 3 isoform X1 [Rhinichthys klamathensis goyatoka]|uniref:FH1/FH2 domain-containing protein 3 isoform X1 n=2 Tax=Rhinichthys klamathensis goyatoka TaxID=3034132 RepID=UPI0024B4AF39|nr:FH1/FH2 domain-containing protein 3 isoform X1 [Rhinichthys klamathensis goyatoka]
MATFACRVQFLDDTDPFNSTNFPEPTRPPHFTFREDIPLINQIAGVHRLLKAPHKLDDCALQLSHNGSYLDLESTLAEQRDELEGFQEDGGRGKKHSIVLRTQLSVRVHACIEKLYISTGRELRRALFSLKQIFQDDKDLVHEFVMAEGLTCLIKVGAEADQNYQNYILRALGQIMLYVDGMNGLIRHNETVQWLYTLVGSKFRLVVKTALKLLLVFVEYTETNAPLLIQAVNTVDTKQGCKPWSNPMEILDEKDGMDTELLVYAMTLINKTLAGLPDQDSFYDVVDSLEEQGMEAVAKRHVNRKGTDLDLVEQFNIYESILRHEDGDDEAQPSPSGHKSRRRASVGATPERRGLERRRSRRHSLQNGKGHTSAPTSPCHSHTPNILPFNGQRIEDISEREEEEEEKDEELQKAELSRQASESWMASTVEEASSLCLPLKCMVNFIPNAVDTDNEENLRDRSGIKIIRKAPVSSPPFTPDFGPPISPRLSSWASVRSLGSLPSQGSSVTSSASTSPSEDPLSPVLPLLSSTLLPACPVDSDKVSGGTLQGRDPDKHCSLSDVKYSNTSCSSCGSNGYAGTYPGRSSGVSSAPSTPHNRLGPSGGPGPDRPTLGGLLTSSYRQHQDSLNAERERRRLEREERLQRIEREERSRFNRDYVDKREEVKQAREERYKQIERLAAEENERGRPRSTTRGRTEITLSLSSRSSSSSLSRSATPLTVEAQEETRSVQHPAQGTESKTSHPVQAAVVQPYCEPLSASVSAPVSPSKPEEEQSPVDPSDVTLSLVQTNSETEEKAEDAEAEVCEETVVSRMEYEKKEEPEGHFEEETNGLGTDECEREQMLDRDVSNVVLSEKERQNEELNEKDNCSASSISSASSTLEREEREEKHVSHSDSGQWADCMNTADANDQCNNVLNSKRFMLDMLYAQNKKGEENEKEKENENEKGCSDQDSSVSSLASRISTLEAHRQACEDNMKKLEVEHLDNQGSVRAVAEKFGDLVKGLVLPHELEHSGKEKQQAQEKPPPAPSPTPPKKESDHIWDQLMAIPRELRIKELDFTDLGEEDDVDILDVSNVIGTSDLTQPHPPPCLPPPPPLFGCPPPPPISGMMMPPPPPFLPSIPPPHLGSPQLSRGEPPLFQKKKKTIRLFWNEVRPIDWQYNNHKRCRESLWSKLDPVKLDTAKLENLFETKSKELPVTKKTAADGKRQEIIVLDSKRSNAINIGLTVLPPPRTIKTAILNFDEYALSKEGIEKILTMIPTEEETQKIQEAQLANPDTPLGSAEQFLLILSSISELSARLQLWAFKMDYDGLEKEVAEPLQDLKEGMDQLEKNKTLHYILSTLLAIGNFLNGTNAKGFELSYLEKVPEVKDTVHKQSLLHHVCSIVVEKFPDSSDLYSEIGAITRSAKVDFDQLQENLCQMERRCKASWDHLKVIAKHEIKPALKQRMSDFLKDCAERIIILKIVHRRIINRFHSFLLFLGHPPYAIREVSVHRFSKILSEFALEYRTTRERVLQQKQKRANHRERNKTRGKMITESGKFAGAPLEGQECPPQGLGYTEDVAEHEQMTAVLRTSLQGGDSPSSVLPGLRTRTRATRGHTALLSAANEDTSNCTNDTADEIMERIVKSATQGPSQRTQPRERRRSRANRKSLRRTLKNGLTPEEAQALGLASSSEMQV